MPCEVGAQQLLKKLPECGHLFISGLQDKMKMIAHDAESQQSASRFHDGDGQIIHGQCPFTIPVKEDIALKCLGTQVEERPSFQKSPLGGGVIVVTHMVFFAPKIRPALQFGRKKQKNVMKKCH